MDQLNYFQDLHYNGYKTNYCVINRYITKKNLNPLNQSLSLMRYPFLSFFNSAFNFCNLETGCVLGINPKETAKYVYKNAVVNDILNILN